MELKLDKVCGLLFVFKAYRCATLAWFSEGIIVSVQVLYVR